MNRLQRMEVACILSVLLAGMTGCKVTVEGANVPQPTPIPEKAAKATVAATQWIPQTSGVDDDLYALAALDAQRCFVVGDGVALKTLDGGATWQEMATGILGRDSLRDVHFVDALNGWMVGKRVYRTTNGGLDWTKVDTFAGQRPNSLDAVTFMNLTTGYAQGDGQVFRTSDGGATWTAEPFTPRDKENRNSVGLFALTAVGKNVWVGGPSLYRYTEGTGWTEAVPGARFHQRRGDIVFTTPTIGWYLQSDPATLNKTTDGGETWQTVRFNGPISLGGFSHKAPPLRLTFLNEQQGWLSLGTTVLRTENGGQSWHPDATLGTAAEDLQVVDNNYGWAVGANGFIARRVGLQL